MERDGLGLLEGESIEGGRSGQVKGNRRERSMPPVKVTLVEIIDEKKNQILLKRSTEGVNSGLWNGLGGEIGEGETPLQAMMREVQEESGLKIKSFMYHGALTVFLGGALSPSFIIYVFSSTGSAGKLKGDGRNELKWFPLDAVPSSSMRQDDFVWLPYVLKKRRWVSGNFEFGSDNLLRAAEIVPMTEGEDFNERVRKSVGVA